MGIGVEGEGHQRELVKRVSRDSDESTLRVGDASPKSMDGNDGLSDDNGDVGARGEEQPGTHGKPPARKRPRSDLEVDTPTAEANNASKESIVKMMKVPS